MNHEMKGEQTMSSKKKEAMSVEMSEEAKEARRAYQRQYYAKNREAMKQAKVAYWERKAAAIKADG